MEGRMFKVSVLLDNDKILKEGQYNLKDIYYTVEKTYTDNGFIRDYDLPDGSMMFYGVNGWTDFHGCGKANFMLENQDWFKRYVKKWIAYENEQCRYEDDFLEVNIIDSFQRAERIARAF
ncbi:MAG: hypothetical protein LBQ40_06200 [Clostridiales bacterium]|jgi:disulfide oxidoreductase YuzD|nr:hypothetical protein [Clostridiales bacterium]